MSAKLGNPKARPKPRTHVSTRDLLEIIERAADHREARNGFTEAMEIVNFTLPKAFSKPDGPTADEVRDRIVDEIYAPLLDDFEFDEPTLEKIKQSAFEDGFCIDVTQEVVAYCVFAVRAYFKGDQTLSWSYACDARYWSGVVMMVAKQRALPASNATKRMLARLRGEQARTAASIKLSRDPKQAAKTEALKLWTARHAGKHPKLRTNEQFAIECMRRWPVLTSAKVICGWCTEWNKAAKKSQPAS